MIKITLLKCILFVFATMLSTVSYSQDRSCGMEAYMEEQMKDPEFARQHAELQNQFKAEVERLLKNDNIRYRGGSNPIVIPVAVHFPTGNEANRACLEAFAQTQVDILNADYTATNTDISLWGSASVHYPGVNVGSNNIYFCLATQNHPINTDADLVEGGPAVTIGWNFGNGGDTDSRWGGYMNFLVKPLGGGTLGYSPLGGSIAAGQSVVMNTFAFGSGAGCPGFTPGAPYNLGRTVTHELGHFYNLDHTFTGSCATDDGIADTPNIAGPNYDCPPAGSVNGCVAGQKALTMNYMDYVNDACMYMFTEGQAVVSTAYLNVLQAQFKPNVTECSFGPGFGIVATNSPYVTSVCANEDTAVYNFNYSTFEGFNETATLTASGLPAGVTATFSPSTMTNAGTFTMTLNNIDVLTSGNYSITVTGTSATVTENVSVGLSKSHGCISVGTTQWGTSTVGVSFNTISNLNSGKPSGYSNYTATHSTQVNRDEPYVLNVRVNTDGNYTTTTRVWIDWNQNCSFDDPGEQYILGTAFSQTNGLTTASPYTITVPVDAVLGNTVMRVTTKFAGDGQPTSCENGHDAEVEDYSIEVLPSLSLNEFDLDSFAIYPNPNNGEFTIKLNSKSGDDIKVNVYDIRGRRIFNNIYTNTTSEFNQTISLNNVQSGMYLVNVNDGRGQVTKKIIVE